MAFWLTVRHVIPSMNFYSLLVDMKMVQSQARAENLVKNHQQVYHCHFPPLRHSRIHCRNSILEGLGLGNTSAKKKKSISIFRYVNKNVKAAMSERIIMKFTQPRKVTITLSFPSSPTAISSVWKNRNNRRNNHATSKDDYCFAICYNFNIFSVKLNNSPKFHS